MKKEIKYFVLGALATFAGGALAQSFSLFSGIRLTQNGSDSAPAYSWNSDQNSGLWRNGADDLVLSVNSAAANTGYLELSPLDALLSAGDINLVAEDGDMVFDFTNAGSFRVNEFIQGTVGDTFPGLDLLSTSGMLRFIPWSSSSRGEIRFLTSGAVATTGRITGSTLTLAPTTSFTAEINGSSELVVAGTGITTPNESASETGYKGVPLNSQSANYTLVLADTGTNIYHPSGGGAGDTYTIPANASVAYPIGTVVTFINDDSNSISVAITSDTMTLAATTTTGTRTVSENGIATAIKVTSTSWIINGSGLL